MIKTKNELKLRYFFWLKKNGFFSPEASRKYLEDNPLPPLEELEEIELPPEVKESVIAYENVNRISKSQENLPEIQRKLRAISELKKCKSKDPVKNIAEYLEIIFGRWSEKPNHWMYLAENYTPKSINSVINEMKKRKNNGGMPLENKGAYFTSLLTKYHPKRRKPKRKEFKYTNGTCKVISEEEKVI